MVTTYYDNPQPTAINKALYDCPQNSYISRDRWSNLKGSWDVSIVLEVVRKKRELERQKWKRREKWKREMKER